MIPVLGSIAVALCFASVVIKWVFTLSAGRLEQDVAADREVYLEARKARDLAVRRHAMLLTEQKQLQARRNAIQQNLTRLESLYQELAEQERREAAVMDAQREMLKEAQRQT